MTSTPPPPPPADPGTAYGFFDSLRRLNMPRSQERWIGGVAGGIAARLGIDPLIVRGIFLVITIFGGFGLLVYGICWALLPEAADGRIHLQEAIRGRFDAALVGAAVFAVIGLSRVGFWWDGWVGIPFMIGMIALVALTVVVITAIRNSGSSSPPPGGTPPPGSGTPPPGAGPSSPTAYPGSGAHTGGPWSDEVVAPDAPREEHSTTDPSAGGQPGATSADSAGQQPNAAPYGAAELPPEDSADAAADQADTAVYSVGSAHRTPEADTIAASPDAAAYTSAPLDPGEGPAPAWPGQQAAGGATSWSADTGATPPAPPSPPVTSPPPPPKPPRRGRPGPGKLLVRATLGLALLLIAGLVLGEQYFAWPGGHWETSPWLVALGAGLVVIGLGVTLAGTLGRRSASLGVIGTILAIVLVPWAISAPVLTQYNFTDSASYGDRYWSPQTPDQAADGYSLAAGAIRVDLSDLADEQVTTPIDIELGAGEVHLVVPEGMPVAVTASVQGETTVVNLSGWSAEVNGEPRDLGNRTELGWRFGTTPMIAELTSPEAENATPIPVNIDVGFGAIEVREQR